MLAAVAVVSGGLLGGQPISDEPTNPPVTDAIAWGCGFTRYYDKATADSWRATFG